MYIYIMYVYTLDILYINFTLCITGKKKPEIILVSSSSILGSCQKYSLLTLLAPTEF
jgi:hypothetical protein